MDNQTPKPHRKENKKIKRGKLGQKNDKNTSAVNSESLSCNQQEFQEFSKWREGNIRSIKQEHFSGLRDRSLPEGAF